MKILITGFQPFGGQRVNPAWEAVRKLPDVLGDKVLWKLEIPVTVHVSQYTGEIVTPWTKD